MNGKAPVMTNRCRDRYHRTGLTPQHNCRRRRREFVTALAAKDPAAAAAVRRAQAITDIVSA